ncbi:UDP-glycosyltransferase 90A1-like [Salvia hispanica]|uniref:UDP-glycosyltransferase 90A1-like n=1 Tax=Salvia hispanica TaxID=49212 RepID=UPI00200962A4|nr:UDP-glycosyltransferase 90A1-like [Salvia hispanica]
MAPLSSNPHIVMFPFMSKGHTIPLLHLTHLLLHRGLATVTIFTTPSNLPFISESLTATTTTTTTDLSIVALPFPQNIPGIPTGAESTDKLPSMSLFIPFVRALELLQPSFEKELERIHARVSCIISDGFLPWTLASASKFGIPRLSFYGMSHYAMAVSRDAGMNGLLWAHESDNGAVPLVRFPWIQITRKDFDAPFDQRDPSGPHMDFIIQCSTATQNSFGLLANTFYELEPIYADYFNNDCKARAWSIGPLCLTKLPKRFDEKKKPWMEWLDRRHGPVLYVAFGSQVQIPSAQLQEIALGLVSAEVSFLWVAKKSEMNELDVETERGLVVTEWVDQEEILEHPSVGGFLSHCGWNSVLDGICAGVPILAWPMMAEQGLNAKMVVEEIKVGLRVETVDGKAKGFVSAESLRRGVRELMEGGKGGEVREKAKEIAAAAIKATSEGGSSWNALNSLIDEIQRQKQINGSTSF